MNKIKNKSAKVARQRASYNKLMKLEQELYQLIECNRLTPEELGKVKAFKNVSVGLNKAGMALKGRLYSQYVKLRSELLEKYNNPVNEKQDEEEEK